MSLPKITIGILSYNHAAFLPATIESAISQTYQNLEIIIVDDGSSDGSLAIAQSYAERHPHMRVLTHPNHINKGISATCNLVVSESQGEYIALLGSDDLYYPYTIAEQVEFLNENPECGLVCGISQIIDKDGNLTADTFGENIWFSPNQIEIMISANKISAPTVMARKLCYEEVGLYDETVVYNDYDMWLRILLFSKWKIGYINKLLALYRLHTTNASFGISRELAFERTLLVYLNFEKKLIERNNKDTYEHKILKKQIAEFSLYLFYTAAAKGETTKATQYIKTYLMYASTRRVGLRRTASIAYRLLKSSIKI